MDRESGQGKGGKGTFMIGELIIDYARNWTRKYARNWIRSMHENINRYADDLNKSCIKQTVSKDLSFR